MLSALRRLIPVLRRQPLLALAAALAAALAPAFALLVGSALSRRFAVAAEAPGYVDVVAVGVATTAVVVGASAALLAPSPSALGPQVAAAPVSRTTLALGATVLPSCAATALLGTVLVLFAVPLGAPGVALALLALACGFVGAAVGESIRLIAVPRAVGLAWLAAVAALWAAAGMASGRWYLGPAGLADEGWASVGLPVVGACGLAAWVGACGVGRPERSTSRAMVARSLPARAGPAVGLVTVRRVLRRPDLRVHGLTAVALPAAAAFGAARTVGVGGAAATAFCVATTLTAAALYPPAAIGLVRQSSWLLDASPQRPAKLAAWATGGGIVAAAGLLLLAGLLALPLGVPDSSVYLQLGGAGAFVLGCAAAAGALVPWHPGQIAQQLASYAAVVAVVLLAWVVVGRLDGAPTSETTFGLLAGAGALIVGVAVAAVAARR